MSWFDFNNDEFGLQEEGLAAECEGNIIDPIAKNILELLKKRAEETIINITLNEEKERENNISIISFLTSSLISLSEFNSQLESGEINEEDLIEKIELLQNSINELTWENIDKVFKEDQCEDTENSASKLFDFDEDTKNDDLDF